MPAFGIGDSSIFFADMGLPVVFGAYSAKGLLDIASADLDDGSGMIIKGRTRVLTFPTMTNTGSASLPGLRKGSSLTVDGTAYLVTWTNPEDDGLTSKAYLEMP